MRNIHKLILISPFTTGIALTAAGEIKDFVQDKTKNNYLSNGIYWGTFASTHILMNYKVNLLLHRIKK